MASSIDPERYAVAAQRFSAFFAELGRVYVERDDVLAQVALGLLSREHVLMTGPPGTAKSQVASAVLGRIVDEKSGRPSVYSRQFTESTVQTDLVGPINFKTLMDTGRTEHFTDEGMLGAVHAYLDEVFDGRDMLLRSALNVLNERELKEGTRVTRGQIECAIMTTNRYLAEVLEGSRETLLAFVDRIGFVNFVPKGFSEPANLARVLARQVGSVRTPPLGDPLTIQDLDVLQAVADSVVVPEHVCDRLVMLLGSLEEEMAGAAKADPEFIATRYLSVRTAVRAARILRAICVYDKIFRDPNRSLEAVQGDFLGLRLHLLLAGPQPEAIAKLIGRESDPRERRQLGIVRTEREIFDRCLAKLPPAVSKPPPVPQKEKEKKQTGTAEVQKIRKALASGAAFSDLRELFDATQRLAQLADEETPASADARALLRETVARLHERALRAGLTAGGLSDRTPTDVVLEVGGIAERLEALQGGSRLLARWLRGRAIALIDETAALAPSTPGSALEGLLSREVDVDTIAKRAETRIADVEALASIRERLRAQGADPDGDEPGARWKPAMARLEEDVVVFWDAAFRQAVGNALGDVPADKLSDLFKQLGPTFARIDAASERITALTRAPSQLKARVVWPRITPLLGMAFERLASPDRQNVIREVDNLLDRLEDAGLRSIVTPTDMLRWTAQSLVRGDTSPGPIDDTQFDLQGYRRVRNREQRVPLVYTLIEVALQVLPEIAVNNPDPNRAATAVADALAKLPERLREAVSGSDVARIQRSVWYLESWWSALSGGHAINPAALASNDANALLQAIARSGFLVVVRDEAALLRYALEARLVAEALPSHASHASELRTRIEALDRSIEAIVNGLVKAQADRAWSLILPQRGDAP